MLGGRTGRSLYGTGRALAHQAVSAGDPRRCNFAFVGEFACRALRNIGRGPVRWAPRMRRSCTLHEVAVTSYGVGTEGGLHCMTEKQRALDAVQRLPDDATVEDAIERLCFIAKVQKGLGQLDRGQGISHDQAKRRILGG